MGNPVNKALSCERVDATAAPTLQKKKDLQRFVDSVLGKTTRLRALCKDLRGNYECQEAAESDPQKKCLLVGLPQLFFFALRAVASLEKCIKQLDVEFDSCNDTMTAGNLDGFSGAPATQVLINLPNSPTNIFD